LRIAHLLFPPRIERDKPARVKGFARREAALLECPQDRPGSDMTARFRAVFGAGKPVIAMVHLGALPGAPLHDRAGGVEGLVAAAARDLEALQAAGFDAVMFGNENDRPYELDVDPASTATAAYVIGRLRERLRVPFGVNLLWDPMSTLALAAATGAAFAREIFTGAYASDMGLWTPDAAGALRYRERLGRPDLALLFNISAEFAYSLDRRSLPDRARSAVFSAIPDAVLVSGPITGEAADPEGLAEVKRVLPDTPVLANTGVRHETVARVLRTADGCVVGSALKVDGDTWNPVDPARAADFMARVRRARGE
jgi:membrane complex biogenesis BtpA family protein